jgi:hypothetical protein
MTSMIAIVTTISAALMDHRCLCTAPFTSNSLNPPQDGRFPSQSRPARERASRSPNNAAPFFPTSLFWKGGQSRLQAVEM